MNDDDRGKIRNRSFATQIRDFSGLRFGTITPTDIDGVIDFADRIFIFIESKYAGRDMPRGQELALERICDAIAETGRDCIILVGEHSTSGDIDFAKLNIVKIRHEGKWRPTSRTIDARTAIEEFVEWCEKKKNIV